MTMKRMTHIISTVVQNSYESSKSLNNTRDNVTPIDHCAHADVAAREILGNRANDLVSNNVSEVGCAAPLAGVRT